MRDHWMEDCVVYAKDENGQAVYVIAEFWPEMHWNWPMRDYPQVKARIRAEVLARALTLSNAEWMPVPAI